MRRAPEACRAWRVPRVEKESQEVRGLLGRLVRSVRQEVRESTARRGRLVRSGLRHLEALMGPRALRECTAPTATPEAQVRLGQRVLTGQTLQSRTRICPIHCGRGSR